MLMCTNYYYIRKQFTGVKFKIIVSKTKFDQLLFIIEWNLNDSGVCNVQPEFTYAVSTQTIYICKHTDLITYFEFMSEK